MGKRKKDLKTPKNHLFPLFPTGSVSSLPLRHRRPKSWCTKVFSHLNRSPNPAPSFPGQSFSSFLSVLCKDTGCHFLSALCIQRTMRYPCLAFSRHLLFFLGLAFKNISLSCSLGIDIWHQLWAEVKRGLNQQRWKQFISIWIRGEGRKGDSSSYDQPATTINF